MAGIEEVSNGDAKLTPGYTVGILQQEPPLDEDKTVIENVRLAFADMVAKVERFDQIFGRDVRPGLRYGRPDGRDGPPAGRDRRRGRLGHRLQARPGHGRAAATRFRHAGEHPLRWRASPRGPVQAPARGTRPAAARRAHQPPRRRVHPVARALPQGLTPAPCSSSRTTATSSTMSPTGSRGRSRAPLPLQGQLLRLPRDQGSSRRGAGPARGAARQAHRGRARLGPLVPEGPSGKEQGASGSLRGDEAAEARASQKVDYTDIRIPVGPRLGSKVLVAEHLHKEFDGRVLIDDLSFTLPRNGIVGV